MAGLSPIEHVSGSTHACTQRLLSRREAKAKLRRLIPGSEEYNKLQDALARTAGIVEISLPMTIYKVCTWSEEHHLKGGFGASEHMDLGKQVKLIGLEDEGDSPPLLKKDKTNIYFHHIVALAGDFYGVVGQPVSLLGGSDAEKTERFQNAFSTLWNARDDEIARVVGEIEKEHTDVTLTSFPQCCYSSTLMGRMREMTKIKEDVDDLLADNSDHFFENAIETYKIGHALAIKIAAEARDRKAEEALDIKKMKTSHDMLKKAYAIEAFACHFLTDLFAAGHVRTQRGRLEIFLTKRGFPAGFAKVMAGILTGAQHEHDGKRLWVSNTRGDREWEAYGDGHYFSPENSANKNRAIEAIKRSVEEVSTSYSPKNEESKRGEASSTVSSSVDELIPFAAKRNSLPLYEVSRDHATLILHSEGRKIEITTMMGFLANMGTFLSHALRYLSEDYVIEMLKGFILKPLYRRGLLETPVLMDKLVYPLIDRYLAIDAHSKGLASHYQLKQIGQQIDAKLEALGDVVKQTHQNTEKILQQLDEIGKKLEKLDFKEINEAKSVVSEAVFLHTSMPDKNKVKKKAHEGFSKLAGMFINGLPDGQHPLMILQDRFKKESLELSSEEIKIKVTQSFQEVLEYLYNAANLYLIYRAVDADVDEDKLRAETMTMDRNIAEVIKKNKDSIVVDLVYESADYVALQLEKAIKIREAKKSFVALMEKL